MMNESLWKDHSTPKTKIYWVFILLRPRMRTEYEIKNKCEDNLEFRIKKKNQIHRKKNQL
jgi:hypothetical protein